MDTTTDQLLQHADFVRRLCRGLLSDADAADDVAQDTLAAALEQPHIRSPRAWLATVARRMAARRLRAEARRAMREAAAARRGDVPAPDEIAAQAELQRRLAGEVRALDEPYRTVVILRYFHDLSPKEIARKLETPYETVHARLRRAHAVLRRRLDETHERRAWMPALAALAWPRRTASILAGASVVAAAALCVTLLALGAKEDRRDTAPRAASAHQAGRGEEGDAGTAGTEPVPEPPEQLRLVRATGRVTTLWGSAIAGARVVVMPWLSSNDYWERYPLPPASLAETTTAADGSFAIEAPTGTAWAILAHAPGHEWTGRELALDVRRDYLNVRLKPGERVAGTVVDEAGVPVAGARVRGVAQSAEIPGAFVRTGSDGRFAFDGASYVHVDHDELAVVDGGGNCAPDQWRVVLGRGETVSGEVVAADGSPVPGARIRLGGWTAGWSRSGTADGMGRFVIDRLPLRERDRFTVAVGGGPLGNLEMNVAFAPALRLSVRLPATFVVRGRVVEMRGEEVVGPVPNVVVKEIPFGGLCSLPEALTDAEGRFELASERPDARDRIEVADGRFFRDWKPQVPDLATEEVGIVVRRMGSVAGRVVDESGRPVPAAAVRVLADEPQRWLRIDEDTAHTPMSDEHGAFKVASTAGMRRAWASTRGFLPSCSEPFSLADAEERTGIVVKLLAGASLTGRVSDPAGRPVIGALVAADGRQTHTNEEGTFVLGGLREGQATVWVSCRGHQTRIMEMAIPTGEPLAVVLEPSFVFRGRLRTPTGEPLPHALLGRGILPAREGSPLESGQGDGWTRTLDDGSFAFRDLGAGRFVLSLRHRGWELTEPKTVYHSATEGAVDVIVRPKAGLSVSGRVLREDGQPFPIGEAPHVTAVPGGTDDLNRWRHAECRPDGSFTLENLEDGEHVLMVKSGQAVFEDRHVAAGVTDMLLQPAKPRRLSGRVLDAAGQPVSGCEVRAAPPGRGPLRTRSPDSRREVRWPVYHEVCWTGPDGGFRFERLVGEQVAIWAFHKEHQLVVESTATDREGVELRLPAGSTLSGVLLDADRRPLADHRVIVAGADKMVRQANTDVQGAFAMRGLAEGACDVSVLDKNGQVVLETTLPAATEGIELRLPAR